MKHLKSGKLLLVVLALSLSACRKDPPPPMDNCLGDGQGGADCLDISGNYYYCDAECMLNRLAFRQDQFANFAAWCYDTKVKNVKPALQAEVRAIREASR